MFGGICFATALQDVLFFRRRATPVANLKDGKQHWFFAHLTRMCAAYIATTTAFVVVNVNFLPQLVVWLGPTVIGSAGITYWTIVYKQKFAKKIAVANVSE